MELNLELPKDHPSAGLMKRYPQSRFINRIDDVTFLYTTNEELLLKFIKLRSELYGKDPKFVGFRNFQDEELSSYTGDHHITQLLMKDDLCIGGGMLTLRKPAQKLLLPLEIDLNVGEKGTTYMLHKILPELELQKHSHVEASRMLVHPDFREDLRYISTMFINLYHRALDENARYFFAMTDKLRCRMYRKIASVHIRKLAYLLNHFTLPEREDFEGIKMQIMVWDIQNTYVEALADRYGRPAL